MTILYLASFVGGLLLAVRVMLYGVERSREDSAAGERSFRLSPPIVVAFTTVFGAVGYTITRYKPGRAAVTAGIAVVLGVLVSVIALYLVKKWWTVTPEHDVDDDRYVLQGHIARVTKPIEADVDGEVSYEMGNAQHVLRARSFETGAGALAIGTEVVIERIENDVAYVEAWMEVEKRL